MMAMTTRSSISVKPDRFADDPFEHCLLFDIDNIFLRAAGYAGVGRKRMVSSTAIRVETHIKTNFLGGSRTINTPAGSPAGRVIQANGERPGCRVSCAKHSSTPASLFIGAINQGIEITRIKNVRAFGLATVQVVIAKTG